MGDMALDVPPSPADAEQGMDAGMAGPTGGEEPVDPVAGGPDDDPLAGDPNTLSAGQGDDISQKYQQLSPDQQDAADKYIDSMLNDDSEAPAPMQQPMESRFNFKHIIDEVFGDRDGNVNPIKNKIERDEPNVNKESMTKYDNPYMPR